MNWKQRAAEFDDKLEELEREPFYLTTTSRFPAMSKGLQVIRCSIGWRENEVPHDLWGAYEKDSDDPMEFFILPSSVTHFAPGGAALKLH